MPGFMPKFIVGRSRWPGGVIGCIVWQTPEGIHHDIIGRGAAGLHLSRHDWPADLDRRAGDRHHAAGARRSGAGSRRRRHQPHDAGGDGLLPRHGAWPACRGTLVRCLWPQACDHLGICAVHCRMRAVDAGLRLVADGRGTVSPGSRRRGTARCVRRHRPRRIQGTRHGEDHVDHHGNLHPGPDHRATDGDRG